MDLSKFAQDPLVLILEELDPESLRRFSQTSRRILVIILAFKPLWYKLELALSGMKNGPPNNHPVHVRLRHLLHYKRALPTLCWSQDQSFKIPMAQLLGVSGGYFYLASPIAFQVRLELYELPSFRVGRTHPCRLRYTYIVPFIIRSVTIDTAQDLMVIGEIFQVNEPISVRLHFRQLSVNAAHSRSSVGRVTFSLDWGDDPDHKVSVHQVEICGALVGMSLRLDIGHETTNRFALVNWRTGQAIMWISEVLSFQFLNEARVIVVVRPDDDDDEEDESEDHFIQSDCPSHLTKEGATAPILAIHNLSNLRDSEASQLRVYHLLDSWSNAISIRIEQNASPKCDSHVGQGTLFYPDPASRIFVLTAIFHPDRAPDEWSVLITHQSIFKSPDSGPFEVPWTRWRRHCLVRDLSQAAHSLRVVGSRILFAESAAPSSSPIPRSRVRLIDFGPHAVECVRPNARSAAPWTWVGRWTTTTSVEPKGTLPHIGTRTTDSYEISKFFATEDNLILLLVSPNAPGALVKVLTFDEHPASHSSRD